MPVLAVAIGTTIALMLVVNATLQQALGPVLTLLVIHVSGLVLIVPLAAFVRSSPGRWKGTPWPLYLGGLVGIALLSINNRTIPVLGAGVTVALGVVGQLATSAVVDHFGLFGLPRRRVKVTQFAGMGLASVGVLLMVWGGR